MRYLNEKYTSEMASIFKMYLKDIADTLSDRGVSVQDMEFTEIELPKPVALSTIERTIKEQFRRFTTGYPEERYVVAIMKHTSGGASIGTFNAKGRLSAINIIKEYGDTDGKVSDVFVTEASDYQIRNLHTLQGRRDRANKSVKDPHDRSAFIHKRLSMMDNPAIKEIVKKAKALGFGGSGRRPFSIKTKKYDNGAYNLYIQCAWESEHWVPGVPHCEITISEPSFGDNSGKADDYIKVVYDLNGSTFGFNSSENTPQEFANAKKKLNEIFDMFENAKELAEFIGTFTYDELCVED